MTRPGNFSVAPTAVPLFPPVNPDSIRARLLISLSPPVGGGGVMDNTQENLVVIRIPLAAYGRLHTDFALRL